MFTRMKTALNDILVRPSTDSQQTHQSKSAQPSNGYGKLQSGIEYSRPLFLGLDANETAAITTQDRSAITPKFSASLPFNAGYCEIINAGKSVKNEDCAVALTINLESSEACSHRIVSTSADVPHTNYSDKEEINSSSSEDKSAEDEENVKGDTSQDNQEPNKESTPVDTCDKEQDVNDNNSDSGTGFCDSLRFDYFAVFDGHAGPAASLYASQMVHHLLTERLREVLHILIEDVEATLPAYLTESYDEVRWPSTSLQIDSLIIGIIQEVVIETDKHLEVDKKYWNSKGGCTVLIAVFMLGRMFVAGAGDSRAVMCRSVPANGDGESSENDERQTVAVPMSQDFTPQTERRRLQYLAYLKPEYLGNFFSRLEFVKRITQSDLGKKVLYRDYHMTGWAYKTVTEEDLKPPMMQGSGKASRLLGTIGVTRGLGDHSVIALNLLGNVPIKPFMSAVPEVRVHDFSSTSHHENDVLVMGSDGLWDVITNEMAAKIVFESLSKSASDDQLRYCSAAKELALQARGELTKGYYRSPDGRQGSPDDITVFVIPLLSAACTHK